MQKEQEYDDSQQITTDEGTIDILYDAEGTKWQQTTTTPTETEQKVYLAGLEIVNGSFTTLQNPNGRLTFTDNAPDRYEFNIKDHLGNVRVYFTDANDNGVVDYTNTEVLQTLSFYPFGMEIEGFDGGAHIHPAQKYKYNGKEELLGGMYDYGARLYDPPTARWTSVDPLAEKFYGWSGYNYVLNNPLRLVDPDGKSPGEFEKNETNTWVKTSTKGDNIGVDFYHDGDITHVTDREGNWNTINDGKSLLSGEERSSDVDYKVLTSEFYNGTGPERSVFIGDNNKAKLIDEANHVHSNYLNFKNSGKEKGMYDTWFGLGILNKLKGDLPNMQLAFMGSFTYSFYKLGDKTLTLAADSKTRTSGTPFHLSESYSRAEGVPNRKRAIFSPPPPPRTQRMTTTHQTYIYFSTY